jgi:hypothetical protein
LNLVSLEILLLGRALFLLLGGRVFEIQYFSCAGVIEHNVAEGDVGFSPGVRVETRAEHPGLCYMLFGLARFRSSLGRLVFSCICIAGLGPRSFHN